MLGLAAPPEIVMADPSEIPRGPPYTVPSAPVVERYPGFIADDPQCNGLTVKLCALRSCQPSFSPETRLSATFTTGISLPLNFSCTQRSRILILSFSSNPVNGFGLRAEFEAPRYARIRRSRYTPCNENLFALTSRAITPPAKKSRSANGSTSHHGV